MGSFPRGYRKVCKQREKEHWLLEAPLRGCLLVPGTLPGELKGPLLVGNLGIIFATLFHWGGFIHSIVASLLWVHWTCLQLP